MADARLQVVAMPPGGAGLREALSDVVREGSVVTAYDDARLLAAHTVCQDKEDVEFLPFGDLVGRVMRMAGMEQRRLASRSQRYAMASLACADLDPTLPLAEAASTKGTHRLFSDRLDELAVFGVDAPLLRSVAARASTALAEKLEALVEIHDLVQDSMDVTRRETLVHRIQACWGAKLDQDTPLNHLVVLAAHEEKPLYDAWLEWLASSGVEVQLLVDLVPVREDLFRDGQRTLARLKKYKRRVVGGSRWYEALFTPLTADDAPRVSVTTSSDPLSECEWVVRECLALIEEGTPASSIGITTRESESYAPLLSYAAARFGLSLDFSRTVPLLSCGLAASVLSMLTTMAHPDARKLLRLAENQYFNVSRDDYVGMEAVLLGGGQSTDRWERVEVWAETDGANLEWLRSLLSWRREHARSHKSLSAWLESLRQIVGETGLADTMGKDPDVSARDMRAQAVLQRSLADHAFIYDQAGQNEMPLSRFISIAEEIWKAETVTFESPKSGVRVTTNYDSLPEVRVLFVLGMLEGSMPRRRREDPLLDDDDRRELGDLLGIRLQDSKDEARRERDDFVRLCASVTHHLALSYPLTNDDRDNVPAYYLEELDRALGGKVERRNYPRGVPAPPLAECNLSPDLALRNGLEGPREWPALEKATDPRAVALLHPDWDEGASPAELAHVLVCPFHSAFRYRLRLRVPALGRGFGALLDIPRRARLVEAPSREEASVRLRGELNALLDRFSGRLESWEYALLQATGERYIEEWADREFAARQVWPRDEGSVFADVALNEHGLKNEFKLDGQTKRFIDRLAGIYKINGVSVAQVYLPSDAGVNELSNGFDADPGAFELGIVLLSQVAMGPKGTGIEVDGGFGRRVIASLPTGSARVPSRHDAGLTNAGISTSKDSFNRSVKERLKESVRALESADARATPGKHCETCLFGDVCRRSATNSGSDSPFDEEAAE
ncbi:MAG: hypothetical protein JSS66_12080 [Armatimonadetes bacterium]|nr:hypothetical protein [Armatimonadota bacterium]